MQEAYLRKWHRRLGIILALFVIIQAGTGLLISLEASLPTAPAGPVAEGVEFLEAVHQGGGPIGRVYRVLLGAGLCGMAISGSLIYFKIRARSREK